MIEVPDQTKTITSLLLSTVLPKDAAEAFSSAFDSVFKQAGYDHPVPPLGLEQLKNGSVKCYLDLTGHLDTAAYNESITNFLVSHDKFICDVLSIDRNRAFELSALINIDDDLAVFELKSPHVPESINTMSTFEFNYWVWHTPRKNGQ